MCLAVPLMISKIVDNQRALVTQGNTDLEINTTLLENPRTGDYVIVHAGFGIEKLDFEEAEKRLELFRQISEFQANELQNER